MKKLIFALFALITLASCQQQPVVYIDGEQAAQVEFKTYVHTSYQMRLVPLNEAQHFVDSVGATKYTIIAGGVIVSSK